MKASVSVKNLGVLSANDLQFTEFHMKNCWSYIFGYN
jgi:hypothetical protein